MTQVRARARSARSATRPRPPRGADGRGAPRRAVAARLPDGRRLGRRGGQDARAAGDEGNHRSDRASSARDRGDLRGSRGGRVVSFAKGGDWLDLKAPAYAHATIPGEKAEKISVGGVTNLMLALAEIESSEQAGLISPDDTAAGRLALRARASLRATILEMEGFDLPDDVRAALKALSAEPPAPTGVEPLPERVPEDVEEQARELILRGVAPPAHWRPFVRTLDFRRSSIVRDFHIGRTALEDFVRSEAEFADAAPLAGLTALTTLDLSDTRVDNAAPLARLTGLRSLHLSGTLIADTAPFARLTELELLDLSRTRIRSLKTSARTDDRASRLLRGDFNDDFHDDFSHPPARGNINPFASMTGLMHLKSLKHPDRRRRAVGRAHRP